MSTATAITPVTPVRLSHITVPEVLAKRENITTALKWGGVVAVGAVVVPVAFTTLALTTAFVVAGGVACATIAAWPVASAKLANWRTSALMEEARRNPIPTLQGQLMQAKAALDKAKAALTTGIASANAHIAQCNAASVKYPDMKAENDAMVKETEKLIAHREGLYLKAKAQVEEFEVTVDKCRVRYDLWVSNQAMNVAFGGIEGTPMDQLMRETAINEVTLRMNETLAQMRVELLDTVPWGDKAAAGASQSNAISGSAVSH